MNLLGSISELVSFLSGTFPPLGSLTLDPPTLSHWVWGSAIGLALFGGLRWGEWVLAQPRRESPAANDQQLTLGMLRTLRSRQDQMTTLNQALKSSRQSEAAVQQLLSESAVAMGRFRVLTDGRWIVDYRSPGYAQVFGLTPAQLAGDPLIWSTRIPPHDWEKIQSTLIPAIRAAQPITLEYCFQNQDGSWRWILDQFTSRWDAAAGCWRVEGLGVDITDLKQSERPQTQLLEGIRAMPLAWMMWQPGQGITFWSDAAQTLLGWTSTEVLGRDPETLVDRVDLPADHLPPSPPQTRRWRHQDGSLRVFEGFSTVAPHPFQPEPSYLMVFWDVESRVQRTQALEKTAAQLTELMAHCPVAISRFRLQSQGEVRYEYCSPGHLSLFGLDPEALGQDPQLWERLVHPADLSDCVRPAQAHAIHYGQASCEYRLTRSDGEHWFHREWSAHWDPAQLSWIVITLDTECTPAQQRQADLKEQVSFYQGLLENTHDLVYRLDANGEFSYVSPQCQDILGYRPSELLGLPLQTLVDPEEWVAVNAGIRALLDGLVPSALLDFRVRQKDGGWLWMSWNSIAIPSGISKGGLTGIQGVGRDIQARKRDDGKQQQWEQDLHLKVEFYKTLFERAPDPAWMMKKGRIQEVNEAFCRWVGVPRYEVIGRSLSELGLWEGSPDLWPGSGSDCEIKLRSGQTRRVRWITETLDRTGEITQMGWIQDLTEEIRLEQQWRISEARFNTLVDNLPLQVWMADPNGLVLTQNLFDMAVWGNLVGQCYPGPQHSWAEQQRWQQERAQVLAGETLIQEETVVAGGSERIMTTILTPIRQGTRIDGILGIQIDLTEQRQTERDLRRTEARFRSLMDTLPFPVWARDREGRCVVQNTADRQKHGIQLGKTVADSDLDDAVKHLWQTHITQALAGEVVSFPFTRSHFSITAPIWNQDRIEGVLGVDFDLKEHRQIEEALRLSEARFHALVDHLPMEVWCRDLTGICTFQNPLDRHHWGDQMGRLLPDFPLKPKTFSTWQEVLDVFNAGQPLFSDIEQIPEIVPTVEGSDRIYWRMMTPLRIEGQMQGVMGVNLDITEPKRLERELHHREQQFRQLTETMDLLFYLETLSGQPLYISPAYTRLWGSLQPEDSDPHAWIQSAHPEDRPLIEDHLHKSRQGTPSTVEYRLVPPHENERWIRCKTVPVYDSQGRLYRLATYSEDITESKQLQRILQETVEALTRSERRFRAIFEQAPMGMAVMEGIDSPRGIQLTQTNPALHHILGYDATELQSISLYDLTHPDDRPQEKEEEKEAAAFRAGLDSNSPGYAIEKRLLHKNGRWIWVNLTCFLFKDQAGSLPMGIATLEDIGRRKQAECELRQSETLFRTLVDNLPLEVWVRDSQGVMLLQNNASRAHWGDLRGTHYLENLPPEMTQVWVDQDARVAAGETLHLEESQPQSGETRLFAKILVPLRVDHRMDGLLGVAIDITAQKQAEGQLRQSLQDKEVMLSEIHHRVKNNLQIISSLLRLQARSTRSSKTKTLLNDSQNRIQTMALIHEHLYQHEHFEALRFADYLTALVRHLEATLSPDPTRIQVRVELEPIALNLDKAILCGLITNELLTNAFKYAYPEPRSGLIWVSFRGQNSLKILTVQDAGVGLPATVDPYQPKSLGLSIVSNLIRQLQGNLEVKQDQGVAFQISFPADGSAENA